MCAQETQVRRLDLKNSKQLICGSCKAQGVIRYQSVRWMQLSWLVYERATNSPEDRTLVMEIDSYFALALNLQTGKLRSKYRCKHGE